MRAILAPPTSQRHHTPATMAERPRAVASHLTDDRDIAPDFDDLGDFHMPAGWVPARSAHQLNHAAVAKVAAELAASVGRSALARAYDTNGIPPGFQRRTIDLALFAASFTTVEENLAAINAALTGPDAHAARMTALPFAERIAALLGTTYDHRPIGVAVGRELGTEETGTEAA